MEVPLSHGSASGSTAADGIAANGAGDAATGRYYDRLSGWTALAARIGYGGGRHALTVHRALADPRAGGRPTFTRVHDVLLESVPRPLAGHILDAGCGLGGTLLALAEHGGARLTGLTLSETQAAIGRRAAARAGIAHRLRILVQSYDDPPDEPFDGIVAIESLAHSPDPALTVRALSSRLAPGGWLAIVDDMPVPAARGTRELAAFQAGWRTPALLTFAELAAALNDSGLTLIGQRELTGELRPRPVARIAMLELLNRLLHRLAPTRAARGLLDSYAGGLALERLYRTGLMTYRLVVAQQRAP